MPGTPPDYTHHPGLRIAHFAGRIRHVPVRGSGVVADILTGILPRPAPGGPCTIRTIHGIRMLVDPVLDHGVEASLFRYGTYEEGTLRILRHLLETGGSFVDAGANIGTMTLVAAKMLGDGGRVFAFEPLPGTFEILCHNIDINGLGNVRPFMMALGSQRGTAEIFDNIAVNRGASTLIRPDHPADSVRTAIVPLDDVLSEEAPGARIACLKIDVEGWEIEVLRGARYTLSALDAPACIVECSSLRPSEGGDTQSLFDFITGVNVYRVFTLERGKERPSRLVEVKAGDALPEHDNLFCLLPAHVERLPTRLFRG